MQWTSTEDNIKAAYNNSSPSRKDLFWNIMTMIVLLAIVVVIAVYLTIFQNPHNALNPLPPPALPTQAEMPTATATLRSLPPTWTVTPPPTATATVTPMTAVIATDAIVVTPGELLPVAAETEQPNAVYAFAVQGEVKGIDATIFRPEHGCNWLGVAGQAFDIQGRPATGITVQVGGSLMRNYIDLISLTGTALWYGQAGFEVFLAEQPTASSGALWVRLLDQSGLPLSPKVYFNTSDSCQQNLVVVNFKQVR